ncbi:MAG: hypothetical protein AAF638_05085 [Pseudomonadota bacterium]
MPLVSALLGLVVGLGFSAALAIALRVAMEHEPRDRYAAKRFNESVKLTSTTANALALGILGYAVIVPLARGEGTEVVLSANGVTWILLGIVLHIMAHGILRTLKPED